MSSLIHVHAAVQYQQRERLSTTVSVSALDVPLYTVDGWSGGWVGYGWMSLAVLLYH